MAVAVAAAAGRPKGLNVAQINETSQDMIKCRWHLRCAQRLGLEVTKELQMLDAMVVSFCTELGVEKINASFYSEFWTRFLKVADTYNQLRMLDPAKIALVEQSVQMGPAAVKATTTKWTNEMEEKGG